MTEKTIQVMADVDANRLLDLIDEDIEAMATLATDAEITKQFETIQKELEGILIRHIDEVLTEKIGSMVSTRVGAALGFAASSLYLELGERHD